MARSSQVQGVLVCIAVTLATVSAGPQRHSSWSYTISPDDRAAPTTDTRDSRRLPLSPSPQYVLADFQPLRQGRRISSHSAEPRFSSQLLAVTSTTPASTTTAKRLVTLRPVGNSIQEILFNNGYRETPGERHPPPDNIDNYNNLDGLDPSEVWLLRGGLMVLKGGSFGSNFIDSEPIDDYQAPYREPKFPPPGYQPDGDLFSGAPLSSKPDVLLPDFRLEERFPESAGQPVYAARTLQARRLSAGPAREHQSFQRQLQSSGHDVYRSRDVVSDWQPQSYISGHPKAAGPATSSRYTPASYSGSGYRSPATVQIPSSHRQATASFLPPVTAGGNYYIYTSPQVDYSIRYSNTER